MTANVGAGDARRPGTSRGRIALLTLGAALVLAVASACGGGSTTGAQSGSHPVPQTGGTLTVWVDSDRLGAAQLYQREHPSVKMNIVSYDGDANGSNYLQTKVSLFTRTRGAWP